jgi:hypothetical protein
MCTKKDIDGVLKQLPRCRNTGQMRLILKEATLCDKCAGSQMIDGKQTFDCHCRAHFRTELQNILF